MGAGTFSEFVVVGADSAISRKPRNWSHVQAASVPLVVLTAFACLAWLPGGDGMERRRVVVAGASGGTGMWCVQCESSFLILLGYFDADFDVV